MAANKVLASLCGEMSEDLLLFTMQRVGAGLSDDAVADAAFELFVVLTATMKVKHRRPCVPSTELGAFCRIYLVPTECWLGASSRSGRV